MKIEKFRNKKSYKWFLCGLILVVVLTISYKVSKANYRISNSIELTTGKVVSSPYDIKVIAVNIENKNGTIELNGKKYKELDKDIEMPEHGYIINEAASYCYKENKNIHDTNVRFYTNEYGEHVISKLSKGDKCVFYFDKSMICKNKRACNYIKKNISTVSERISENKDFNVIYNESTTGKIFLALDEDGETYYYAGNPTDNWVVFGEDNNNIPLWWRIIRINGDGSIRLIYSGASDTLPQTEGEETQIGKSQFNDFNNDNKYVGYFYEQNQVHGTKEQSTIYKVLNNWYNDNIKDKQFEKYIDMAAGYCNDRNSYQMGLNNESGGIGTINTVYAPQTRLIPGGAAVTSESPAVKPTFKCNNEEKDLFTFKGNDKYFPSTKGNKMLDNPVGLLTADEASYAGLAHGDFENTNNYLYTKSSYWTISPYYYYNEIAHAAVYFVGDKGNLTAYSVTYNRGVRPVINLRSDVTFTGDGTISNPYKVI